MIEIIPPRQKTTMSVPEMRKILGLKKTDAYWLIKKNQFEIIIVGGKMRIKIDSFERWYASQFHYKKIDGTPPGQDYEETISLQEVAAMLGIPEGTAGDLIRRKQFVSMNIRGSLRISRKSFDEWYLRQTRYTKLDQTSNGQVHNTISSREMADLLGIPLRNTAYYLLKKGVFKTMLVDGQIRVDINSFNEWYAGQSHYKKISDGNGGKENGINCKA